MSLFQHINIIYGNNISQPNPQRIIPIDWLDSPAVSQRNGQLDDIHSLAQKPG